ncbi:hypothetical protein [Endozoicomonas sp. 8E]|uniref:hypothetical protein n=1 Tax=Endozoicomonas sp. 8E TaxID=3035692 RepID=UPI002938F7A2|nr:hypothetical protein [Endozoicomonas sp. 8E]WOG29584.1 hypothetical protein P6910_08010 [Endozoicomonas sp. 8E]
MTNTRPNALSLAITIAISSSLIDTQALADRRLQTKSVDISGSGHVEFIQSEVMVQPTLDDDQQPIPKSFTTTYPDQTEVRAGYDVPSEGFTDILSGIDGGVSSVDLFETDEKGVAQKYTKVLKVGNEGIFRFIHNLAEKALVIEVRNEMTNQNSIEAVRNQSGDLQPLEPSTKIASPEQLARVLKGAHKRAGNLGQVDHYVALATIEVDDVEVNGRTFMRLIAAGAQPPGLKRLGQSLFVNDEVLYAAATSAYTQVHVLGEDLQQEALNNLLSYHQPVGYVMHVEHDTQAYPVPPGYPKLEVAEPPGEIIVFRGQKQNPADVAFVEGLYDMWSQEFAFDPPSEAKTLVKKDKVKSYQYTIRSRQMTLLEGFAAEYNAELNEDEQTTLAYEDELRTLSYYEYLQHALSSATSDEVDEFDLTVGQIEVASWFVTPTLMHYQLEKHFSFKPAFRNLLTNRYFIRDIQTVIPDYSDINLAQAHVSEVGETFASKVMRDISRQLIEIEIQLLAQQVKEREYIHLRNQLKLIMEKASSSEQKNPLTLVLNKEIENELAKIPKVMEGLQNQLRKFQQKVKRIPDLKQPLRDAREEARKAYYIQRAADHGIVDWDDTQPLAEQARRIEEHIHLTNWLVAKIATPELSYADAEQELLAIIKGQFAITPDNKHNHRAFFQFIQQGLLQGVEPINEELRLLSIEEQPGLIPKQHREEALEWSEDITQQQAQVLDTIHTFTQQAPLKKQALEAAIGLTEAAIESGKAIPSLTTFDFDDEFAPIRLRAMVGKDLTFNQASRIVEVFKSLKVNYPTPSFETEEDRPLNILEEIQALVQSARNEIGKGAQPFDNVINGMGDTAIHYVEHDPKNLKDFPEYFTTHSASANKIITLLREGLVSKIELEHYMKAVRGVDGYQTVAEFEHFLGYKHGVRVPEFRKVVQMLSDEGTEAFMQSAFTPVTVTVTSPVGMEESVASMKEYAAAVIANYLLDDTAFENSRRTAVFLSNVQDTLTPYANIAGLSESGLIKVAHGTWMQTHAAAVERQLMDYWVKPSAFLVQAVTWYYSSYKPLLVTHTASQANTLSLSNMSLLYLLDLTNRGDYLHRMLTPFQHWLEGCSVDLDRTGQYAYHNGIEQVSEVGGLAMPPGKAASSVILLRTGSMLFARQYNANPHRYRSISRLVPEIVKSMGSGQGVQVPLLHRVTPQKVKTLASATVGLILGPIATVGAYAHGLISGFTYAQTFGFALTSSLTFDFFMNDNKMLTQWLGGPLGRSLDKINRWRGLGETNNEYLQRTAIASPQRFSETDEEYASRVKANNRMYGWTRHENYLQFRERRVRTMKLFENGWEKYFRENVPKWSFTHAESIPYFYTLGVFYKWRQGDDKKVHGHDKRNAPSIKLSTQL